MKKLKTVFNFAFQHKGFRRYFSNTSWMLGEQILRMIAGLLVGVWVARYLGPIQFGIFSYVIAFVSIFGVVAKLGLDSIVVRDILIEPEKRDIYLGTAFWLKFIGAFLTLTLVISVLMSASTDGNTNLYILIIAGGLIFQSYEVIDFYFQSQALSKFVSSCKLMQLLLSSILKIYLILTGAHLIGFVIVSLIDQVTLSLSLYFSYKYQNKGSFYQYFSFRIAKNLLTASWPLVLTGLVIMVYMRIDQIMIKSMLGDREVGIYSAAVRLCEVWYFIPMIIANSLFPAIVLAKKVGEELYYFRLQRLYTFMVWIALLIAIFMTFLSDWLVVFIYGKEYSDAGGVLAISIWAGVLVFFGAVKGKWQIIENMQFYSAFNTTVGALSNIALNLILIPAYGILGAAIATLCAHLFSAIMIPLMFQKDRRSVIMFLNALVFKTYIIKTNN